MTSSPNSYEALLVVSFGGPEGPEQVVPFLENVLRGRNVPRARLEEVAEHYQAFGGVSPLNQQNRELIAALEAEFQSQGLELPIYFGNRNWHPLLADTLAQMRDDGIRRALGFFTSAFSSYSGCRQYRENIAAAQAEVGSGAPEIDKLRMFYNHPGYIETMVDRALQSTAHFDLERQTKAKWLFTAHSIPSAMAVNCRYEAQLGESSRLVAEALGLAADQWQVVFQSRSGPPTQPWLEPDVCDAIRSLNEAVDLQDVVLVPIGFISDHMEVIYDLDTEALGAAKELGVDMVRVPTAGTHPRFVSMIRELVVERMIGAAERPALGTFGPSHDVCPADCCLYTPQRPSRPS